MMTRLRPISHRLLATPSVTFQPAIINDVELVDAFLTARKNFIEGFTTSHKIGYLTVENAALYCGEENTEVARKKFIKDIQSIGGTSDGIGICFDLTEVHKPASDILDELLNLPFLFLDCSASLILASLLASRQVIGTAAFNRLYSKDHIPKIRLSADTQTLPYQKTFMHKEEGFHPDELPDGRDYHVFIEGSPFYTITHGYGTLGGFTCLLSKEEGSVTVTAFQEVAPQTSLEGILEKLRTGAMENPTYYDLQLFFELCLDKTHPNHGAAMTLYSEFERENGTEKVFTRLHHREILANLSGNDRSDLKVPRSLVQQLPPVGVTMYEVIHGLYTVTSVEDSHEEKRRKTW